MMRRMFFALAGLAPMGLLAGKTDLPSGDAVIRAPAAGSEIVITTTSRLAGAIDSLKWKGQEFIDSADHGRQLQSASNLDCGTPIANETFNPTEAGSRDDGAGRTSSSRLLFLRSGPGELQTVTQMAFWLAPGEKSGGNPAKNTTILSDHLLTKRVKIGCGDMPNVICYDVTFSLPMGERHTLAVFEALTGYMPPVFEKFEQLDPVTLALEPLDDGPGEIAHPIIFSTASGSHAMGIYAPPQPAPGLTGPTFGRFRFPRERVVKWNCVFRLTRPEGIPPAGYSFRMYVIVGDVKLVADTMRALLRKEA